ncbi:MAG: fatty acid desaturase [Desulfobacteraceae bacterium]|nr:MAG: fatty acid desaturase [Desulfobacteraceae bacterium]
MTAHEADRTKIKAKSVSPGRNWPDWYAELAAFRNPSSRKAVWQLINTLVPYGCLWYLMIRSIQLDYPYALTLLLALPAGAFLVRIFILFHDCVHGSFFARQGANTFFGYLLGVLVFTSFEDWRFAHLRHHVTYANLDARGFGDIWTMTLAEYESSSRKKRLQYRLYRNPLVMIGLGALFTFFLANRLPKRKVRRKERVSVLFTNLLIVIVILAADRLFGWRTYLLIQLPVFWFAGAAGVWLFYVQHQFPGGYWARKGEWQPLRAAMQGSSFYQLPAVLRWFSSNIGYHHAHHLSPRIPNYRLKKCYDSVPALQTKAPLTIAKSLSCVGLNLWDEDRREMVAFPGSA